MRDGKRLDLHTHTSMSDGTHSPEEIVEMARRKNIGVLAITDHDTTKGVRIAKEYVEKNSIDDIKVIPGIELEADWSFKVHIIGLFVDIENETFKRRLAHSISIREKRNQKYLTLLSKHGINLTMDMVSQYANGKVIGKPHFVRCLIDKGYFDYPKDAYAFLNDVEFRSIDVRKPSLKEVITMIKEAGGVAILAHPFERQKEYEKIDRLLISAKRAGLDGIEVQHSAHSYNDIMHCIRFVCKYNLLVSGGSDFHGENVKPGVELGTGKNRNVFLEDIGVYNALEARSIINEVKYKID